MTARLLFLAAAVMACDGSAPDPCAGVTCSGHGTCVADGIAASCACDVGWSAVGLSCALPAPEPDAGSPDSGPPIAIPTPLRPWNGQRTGSVWASSALRPRFTWTPVAEATRYELQLSDECAVGDFAACAFLDPVESSGSETSFVPAEDLEVSREPPVGRRWFWRVRACRSEEGSCSAFSPTRYVDVGRQDGDFDGDGYADIIVGASGFDAPGAIANAGAAYSYRGSDLGIDPAGAVSLQGPAPQPSAQFGLRVGTAGDVDADGFFDAVVSAFGQAGEGAAYVYLGSAEGLAETPSLELDNPDDQAAGGFGFACAAAGDVNADGYDDVIVGAFTQDAPELDEGNVFVYLGSSQGLVSPPDKRLDSPSGAGGLFGYALAPAGDVSGDGYADVVVGAHLAGDAQAGEVYLYYGSDGGLPARPSILLPSHVQEAGARFGFAVSSAGDVDGDGYADVIVGADRVDHDEADAGAAFVYLGSSLGLRGEPFAVLNHPEPQIAAHFGWCVASAGDLDADGHDDLVVGALFQDVAARLDQGRAYVYFGSALGPEDPPLAVDDPVVQVSSAFGAAVAPAGDTNGDGFADLVMGAYAQDTDRIDDGSAWVFEGLASRDLLPSIRLASPAHQTGAYFGIWAAQRLP